MKTLFGIIYYLLITGIVIVALLLSTTFLPIPGNFKVKVVKSGSMEPVIKTGGIVVMKPESAYKVGDVVTFGPDTKTQIPTTHRIVGIGSGPNPLYTTKGDANDAADQATTHLSDIDGKVLFTLPYLGYVLDFARKPLGFALLVGVPALAIILEELSKIFREIQILRKKKRPQARSMAHRVEKRKPVPYSNYNEQQNYKFRGVVDLRSL